MSVSMVKRKPSNPFTPVASDCFVVSQIKDVYPLSFIFQVSFQPRVHLETPVRLFLMPLSSWFSLTFTLTQQRRGTQRNAAFTPSPMPYLLEFFRNSTESRLKTSGLYLNRAVKLGL